MNLQLGDFLHQPYLHGWDHFQQFLYADENYFSDEDDEDFSSSLIGRVSHLTATLFLWCPVVNIITHVMLKFLFSEDGLDETDSSSQIPITTTQIQEATKRLIAPKDKKPTHEVPARTIEVPVYWRETFRLAESEELSEGENSSEKKPLACEEDLRAIFDDFVGKLIAIDNHQKNISNLRDIADPTLNPETSPYYDQTMSAIFKLCDELSINPKICMDWFLNELNIQDSEISDDLKTYATYMLQNNYSYGLLRMAIISRPKWNVIHAPGDGKCLLWSCVLGKKLLESENYLETYSNLKNLYSNPDLRASLEGEVSELKAKIVEKFQELINHSNPDISLDIRRKFIGCAMEDSVIQKVLKLNVAKLSAIHNSPECSLTPEMIERYCKFVMERRSDNASFEAEMISRIYEHPIVILKGSSDRRLTWQQVCGSQYIEKSSKNPIVVRFSWSHYDCLS